MKDKWTLKFEGFPGQWLATMHHTSDGRTFTKDGPDLAVLMKEATNAVFEKQLNDHGMTLCPKCKGKKYIGVNRTVVCFRCEGVGAIPVGEKTVN